MKRPTLAECLGVSERWQALACLYTMINGAWSEVWAPWSFGWAERASVAVLRGDEDTMRETATLALQTARGVLHHVGSVTPEPDRVICRLIAWELACELVERRMKAVEVSSYHHSLPSPVQSFEDDASLKLQA